MGARESIRISTFTSALRAAERSPRFMRAVRRSPRHCSHSTPNMSMRRQRLRCGRHSCSMTGICWLQTRGGGNQRSSEDPEPERDTRNRIVRLRAVHGRRVVFCWFLIAMDSFDCTGTVMALYDGLCGYDTVM